MPIERIARRAGYGSQAAFTRAFRLEYGKPPSRYQGGAAATLALMKRRPDMYPVELVDSPSIPVAALAHEGDYNTIGKTFERLVRTDPSYRRPTPTSRLTVPARIGPATRLRRSGDGLEDWSSRS